MPSPRPIQHATATRMLYRFFVIAAATYGAGGIAAPASDAAAMENGRKLIEEAKCEACHIAKVGGDGSAIYTRKDRRVTAHGKLLPQVARCNNELNLGLFPDDEAAIAACLNTRHYKFKD